VATGIPAIGSAHSVYRHYRDRPIDRLALRIAAVLLRKLTAISERMRSGFPRFIAKKMVIIANPTLAHGGLADVAGGGHKTVLCVGRLGPEKDHATLISAFAQLAARFPDWRLRIVGEGALRHDLQRLVDSLALGDRIELAGVVRQIGDEYAAAQLFVLPSRYESFGLVTAEAMVHGLPVLAFADCDGAREIVHHGVNGLLVGGSGDRTANLAEAMARLMDSPDERQRLGDAGRGAKFDSIESIVNDWEALLGAVAGGTVAMGETKPKLGEAHRR
jgi:glycosyltransferase involved in cell wall biosynthesis